MEMFKRDNKYLWATTWPVFRTSSPVHPFNQSCHPLRSLFLLSLRSFFRFRASHFLPFLASFFSLFSFFFLFPANQWRTFSSTTLTPFVVWILILFLERSIVERHETFFAVSHGERFCFAKLGPVPIRSANFKTLARVSIFDYFSWVFSSRSS